MRQTDQLETMNTFTRKGLLARRVGPDRAVFRQFLRLPLFGLAIMVILGATILLSWQSEAISVKAGQIADRTIKAPRTATFTSELKTMERRQEAYDDARNIVLRADPSVAPTQMGALNQALNGIDAIRADKAANPGSAAERIRSTAEGISADDAVSIRALPDDAWGRVKVEARRLLSGAFLSQIRAENVAAVKEGLLQESSFSLTNPERQLAANLARLFIQANVQVDADKTKAAREAAANNVEPVMVTVQQGQVIVRDGDPVAKYDIEKLQYFGLLTAQDSWQQLLGNLGVMGIVTLALILYLYKFMRGVWESRQLLLIGLVVLLPVVAGRIVLQDPELRFMFPAAAVIMLLAVLMDFQVAAVIGTFVALYLGIVSGSSFDMMFVFFFGAIAGAGVIWRAQRTMTFLRAGFAVAAATFASAASFALYHGDLTGPQALNLLMDSALNGGLSAALTFFLFSLLGTLFGITTHLQLLELAHPNQPLLYRLAREASGTYHHSIVVSNLAESAVEQVGGDPLLARVAVLYHDIGKVEHPSFFVENQVSGENVHDALDPRISAQIIRDHVFDGIRLARQAHLPKAIIDIIEQHHGTTLIRYFYAAALNGGQEVEESSFRYPGSRPQTKEAGVIMLADGVEAAVRAAVQAGKLYEDGERRADGAAQVCENKLQEIVDEVIRARLEDRQLDECALTLKDLENIREAFILILEGIYHPRVEYPKLRAPEDSATSPEPAPVEIS
jgi:putative nucleotidyltransferase with HDIG domain